MLQRECRDTDWPKSSIGEAWLSLPSLPEQRAIADFLDRETAKIDTLVAKKRTLIERLKEKRTALISRTVTRGLPPDAARAAGLDPHPKLKPSGIDWLGDVPEHWTCEAVWHQFVLETRPTSSTCRRAVSSMIPTIAPVCASQDSTRMTAAR